MVLPPGLVQPRFATPRNYSRPSYGLHCAAVGASLGQPFIPWQQYVADVATETDADGVLVYDRVVITVQRQAGKTTLDLASGVQNALSGPNRRIWYTAQTGQHASDKWLQMVEDFEGSPIKRLGSAHRSNGKERLTFLNSSTLRPHPPTGDSLHSKQSDRNTIDEAWFFDLMQANALKQAIVPTTTTRRKKTGQRPQLWVMSTEGTADSTYFNDLLAELRTDCPPTTAFFDFGIDADTDPTDLEAVYRQHPGAGHLFDLDDLQGWLTELGPSEFARAFGNRRTGSSTRVIPAAPWNAARSSRNMPDGPVCFGAATGIDGQDTSIVAVKRDGGTVIVQVIAHAPGTSWALEVIRSLHDLYKAPFAIDKIGPSALLHDEVERSGIPLVPLTTGGVTAACMQIFNGVTKVNPPSWVWLPDEWTALDRAADLAVKRTIGDGAWTWGRARSVGSISALEAATVGTYGIDHMPESHGLQLFA